MIESGVVAIAGVAALACTALVAIIYRLRRDVTGPDITAVANTVSWVSLGALVLWLGAGLLAADGGTQTDDASIVPLGVVELACAVVMVWDTTGQARRRSRSRPPPPGGHRRE